MSPSDFDLKKLIAPSPVDDFLRHYWPYKPIVIESNAERLNALLAIPELASVKALASRYRERVTILHPQGFAADVPDGATAIQFLRGGYTLYFRNIGRYLDVCRNAASVIAKELGIPTDSFTCEVFASSGESGVAMHCDYDVNFSILLAGRKEWTFAPNESVVNQTNIILPAGRTQPDQNQLRYITKDLPAEMPESATHVVLDPGGLVFMPRGMWHTTKSHGECLSINFVMKGPHWARLLCASLENKLMENPSWREYAYGVDANDERHKQAIGQFSALLSDLGKTFSVDANFNTIAEDLIKRYLDGK